jgi:hypothetical protein
MSTQNDPLAEWWYDTSTLVPPPPVKRRCCSPDFASHTLWVFRCLVALSLAISLTFWVPLTSFWCKPPFLAAILSLSLTKRTVGEYVATLPSIPLVAVWNYLALGFAVAIPNQGLSLIGIGFVFPVGILVQSWPTYNPFGKAVGMLAWTLGLLLSVVQGANADRLFNANSFMISALIAWAAGLLGTLFPFPALATTAWNQIRGQVAALLVSMLQPVAAMRLSMRCRELVQMQFWAVMANLDAMSALMPALQCEHPLGSLMLYSAHVAALTQLARRLQSMHLAMESFHDGCSASEIRVAIAEHVAALVNELSSSILVYDTSHVELRMSELDAEIQSARERVIGAWSHLDQARWEVARRDLQDTLFFLYHLRQSTFVAHHLSPRPQAARSSEPIRRLLKQVMLAWWPPSCAVVPRRVLVERVVNCVVLTVTLALTQLLVLIPQSLAVFPGVAHWASLTSILTFRPSGTGTFESGRDRMVGVMLAATYSFYILLIQTNSSTTSLGIAQLMASLWMCFLFLFSDNIPMATESCFIVFLILFVQGINTTPFILNRIVLSATGAVILTVVSFIVWFKFSSRNMVYLALQEVISIARSTLSAEISGFSAESVNPAHMAQLEGARSRVTVDIPRFIGEATGEPRMGRPTFRPGPPMALQAAVATLVPSIFMTAQFGTELRQHTRGAGLLEDTGVACALRALNETLTITLADAEALCAGDNSVSPWILQLLQQRAAELVQAFLDAAAKQSNAIVGVMENKAMIAFLATASQLVVVTHQVESIWTQCIDISLQH